MQTSRTVSLDTTGRYVATKEKHIAATTIHLPIGKYVASGFINIRQAATPVSRSDISFS